MAVVTEEALGLLPEPEVQEHPARPLGGSDDGASCHSSSAGDGAWLRGGAEHVAVKHGHPSPSSQLLPAS